MATRQRLKHAGVPQGLASLVGLPEAQPFEAPSSWLTRAALSQAASPGDLLQFLGFNKGEICRTDLDLLLMTERGRDALKTGGATASLPVAENVFRGLEILDPRSELLLRDARGRARCRYCPECLREQRTAHLEVHCRFRTWRACPLHKCLLEDRCPHCQGMVILPFEMITGGPKKGGIAYLSHCQHCARKLYDVEPIWLDRLGVTKTARERLDNGRSLMAALYYGKVKVGDGRWRSLRRFRSYIRATTFWPPADWYTAHEVRAARK